MNPKILIISDQRSGTNLLTRILDTHPGLFIWYEPFCHPQQFGMTKQWELNKVIDNVYQRSNGGAIHRTEHVPDNWKGLWPKLANIPDLKVVDLKRKNLLRRYLSLMVAEKTKKWIDIKSKPKLTKLPQVTINPELLDTNFSNMTRLYRQRDRLFRQTNPLYITYEQLGADVPGTVTKVLDFIGVNRIALQPQTSKRESRPLKEAITNYDELKRDFSNTVWGSFFEE